MVRRGSYCLVLGVLEDIDIRAGALGVICFPKGTYVYVGSALNGLDKRIERHRKTNRGEGHAIHWHIDYLLSNPNVKLRSVYLIESNERVECDIARTLSSLYPSIKNFGSSDCECTSHLFTVKDWKILEKMGLKETCANP